MLRRHILMSFFFFFSSRRRHTRLQGDWSSDVCSSDLKPMRSLAKLSTDFSKAMASADRISEVLDTEPEIQDRPDAIEAASLRGDIEFRGVSFDYADGKDVLRQVSFQIARGQRLALVGASGAGKSTIVSLILRLYEPQEGAILVDGVDIRQYRRGARAGPDRTGGGRVGEEGRVWGVADPLKK